MGTDTNEGKQPFVGDLAGAGMVLNSEVARRTYNDALSPPMRQLGSLSEDALKAFRLFTAPIQLLAVYQDRLADFCDRVRKKVPNDKQRDAPPEIARPVMEAIAYTSDDSPLMRMFEELMARAINIDESDKLSPTFPTIIQSLTPLEAKLVQSLTIGDQYVDAILDRKQNLIIQILRSNFDMNAFGGHGHHLTIAQDLSAKNLVTILNTILDSKESYPEVLIPEKHILQRMTFRLSMFGKWFATSCTDSSHHPQRPK